VLRSAKFPYKPRSADRREPLNAQAGRGGSKQGLRVRMAPIRICFGDNCNFNLKSTLNACVPQHVQATRAAGSPTDGQSRRFAWCLIKNRTINERKGMEGIIINLSLINPAQLLLLGFELEATHVSTARHAFVLFDLAIGKGLHQPLIQMTNLKILFCHGVEYAIIRFDD